MPGGGHLHGLIRAVVFFHRLESARHAPHARREVRTVIARDDGRRGRSLEIGLFEVLTARDAVDVLMLVVACGLGTGRRLGLALTLRQLRLSLHG